MNDARTRSPAARVMVCLAGLLLLLPLSAAADIARAVNDARLNGCNGSQSLRALKQNSRLNAAARRLSEGDSLESASRHAGYRAASSASVQITNVPDDRDIQRIIEQRFCTQVSDPHLQEIGTFRRGADIWLLMASAFSPPKPADHASVSLRVLELTNQARAHARRCGSEPFPAAGPLTLAPVLEKAAIEHSRDMARHDYMDHTGRDGSSPADRITRAGYKWRLIGENLASGITNPDEAVNGWVGSPHHCANLMDGRFTQMAVAFALDSSSSAGIYWTQVFGTPR